MRLFFALLLCFSTFQAIAQERPRMSPMEETEEAPVSKDDEGDDEADAEAIFSSVAENCHNRNFSGFLSHFTSSRAKAIRTKMKKAMDEGVEMRISGVDAEPAVNGKVKARCKYFWDSPSFTDTNLITSDFILKKEGGKWKIDEEKVVDSRVMPKQQFANINFGAGIAGEDGFVDFGPRADEEEFPAIPPGARTYEGSCANGRCGMAK